MDILDKIDLLFEKGINEFSMGNKGSEAGAAYGKAMSAVKDIKTKADAKAAEKMVKDYHKKYKGEGPWAMELKDGNFDIFEFKPFKGKVTNTKQLDQDLKKAMATLGL